MGWGRDIESAGYRTGWDDLLAVPRSSGDYRSTLYPTIAINPTSTPVPSPPHSYGSKTNHSTISELVRTHKESETNSINREQQIAAKIREMSSNVGFVSLPDQVHRRAVKKGFEFNLMVVGKSSHFV